MDIRSISWDYIQHRSEGFALTGYVVPGCVEYGAWMLWGNSYVVAAAAVLARSFLGFLDFPTNRVPAEQCSCMFLWN